MYWQSEVIAFRHLYHLYLQCAIYKSFLIILSDRSKVHILNIFQIINIQFPAMTNKHLLSQLLFSQGFFY